MNTKYTPGPWEQNADFPHDIKAGDKWIATAEDVTVGFEQAKANARLIAAAPELLNWLVELVGQVSTLSADAKAQISPMTLAQARAAIAKATYNTNL